MSEAADTGNWFEKIRMPAAGNFRGGDIRAWPFLRRFAGGLRGVNPVKQNAIVNSALVPFDIAGRLKEGEHPIRAVGRPLVQLGGGLGGGAIGGILGFPTTGPGGLVTTAAGATGGYHGSGALFDQVFPKGQVNQRLGDYGKKFSKGANFLVNEYLLGIPSNKTESGIGTVNNTEVVPINNQQPNSTVAANIAVNEADKAAVNSGEMTASDYFGTSTNQKVDNFLTKINQQPNNVVVENIANNEADKAAVNSGEMTAAEYFGTDIKPELDAWGRTKTYEAPDGTMVNRSNVFTPHYETGEALGVMGRSQRRAYDLAAAKAGF